MPVNHRLRTSDGRVIHFESDQIVQLEQDIVGVVKKGVIQLHFIGQAVPNKLKNGPRYVCFTVGQYPQTDFFVDVDDVESFSDYFPPHTPWDDNMRMKVKDKWKKLNLDLTRVPVSVMRVLTIFLASKSVNTHAVLQDDFPEEPTAARRPPSVALEDNEDEADFNDPAIVSTSPPPRRQGKPDAPCLTVPGYVPQNKIVQSKIVTLRVPGAKLSTVVTATATHHPQPPTTPPKPIVSPPFPTITAAATAAPRRPPKRFKFPYRFAFQLACLDLSLHLQIPILTTMLALEIQHAWSKMPNTTQRMRLALPYIDGPLRPFWIERTFSSYDRPDDELPPDFEPVPGAPDGGRRWKRNVIMALIKREPRFRSWVRDMWEDGGEEGRARKKRFFWMDRAVRRANLDLEREREMMEEQQQQQARLGELEGKRTCEAEIKRLGRGEGEEVEEEVEDDEEEEVHHDDRSDGMLDLAILAQLQEDGR